MRVWLVTGARSGIGRATVVAACQAGHRVYAGLRDPATGDALRAEAPEAIPLPLDITDPAQREAAVARILEDEGRLDVLVNNAGVGVGGFLEELPEAELRAVLEVNLFGSWAMTVAALPALRASKGHLIFVSSLSGRMAIPAVGAYAVSKFALEALGETLRHELAPHGVRVVLAQPGAVSTPMTTDKVRFVGPTDGPYGRQGAAMRDWYERNVTARGCPPSVVGEGIVDVASQAQPPLRVRMGPRTRRRQLAMALLPFRAIERFWARAQRGPE